MGLGWRARWQLRAELNVYLYAMDCRQCFFIRPISGTVMLAILCSDNTNSTYTAWHARAPSLSPARLLACSLAHGIHNHAVFFSHTKFLCFVGIHATYLITLLLAPSLEWVAMASAENAPMPLPRLLAIFSVCCSQLSAIYGCTADVNSTSLPLPKLSLILPFVIFSNFIFILRLHTIPSACGGGMVLACTTQRVKKTKNDRLYFFFFFIYLALSVEIHIATRWGDGVVPLAGHIQRWTEFSLFLNKCFYP